MRTAGSVGVGGQNMVIQELKTEDMPADDLGHMSWEKKLIQLDKSQDPDDLWGTLYHEVFHAGMHQSGLHWLVTHDMEEALTRMFEHIVLPSVKELHLKEIKKRKNEHTATE